MKRVLCILLTMVLLVTTGVENVSAASGYGLFKTHGNLIDENSALGNLISMNLKSNGETSEDVTSGVSVSSEAAIETGVPTKPAVETVTPTNEAVETTTPTGEAVETVEPSESIEPTKEVIETEVPTKPAIETEEPDLTAVPVETENPVTEADLKLIYTTDIHGQVINYDYQSKKFVNRGLNLLYSLVQDEKKKAGEGNYLTFDVGDSVMDFTTDYIYKIDPTVDQPVYKAVKLMGYDAITMGNHDFDYGYDYLMTQLQDAELTSSVVLSNVYSANTLKAAIGEENRIIEKTITNDEGKQIKVKVGVFGETTPALSTKTEAFKDKLVTEDIVANATKQVQSLKAAGADIVVCLAHTGFGEVTPEYKDANAAYALTTVEGIDVILAGHEHGTYPLTNGNTDKHYLLPGVDANTGLMNGKRIIMVPANCQKIGVIDLHLTCTDGVVGLEGSDWSMVSPDDDTVPNEAITATMGQWNTTLNEYCSKELVKIKDEGNINNYLSAAVNTPIMQLIHNTQFDYATRIIAQNAPEYASYPVISVARYKDYNNTDVEYANINNKVMVGDVEDIINYHKYAYIYKMTAGQLREWLEWGASMYQTVGTGSETNDVIQNKFLSENVGNLLIQEQWQNNLSKAFEASGVEYTVDITKEPRYNPVGLKISESRRISPLSINGAPLPDEQEIVVVTEKISQSIQSDANPNITKNVIWKSHDVIQDEVRDYIQRRSYLGDLSLNVNKDKTLYMPLDHRFLFVTNKGAYESNVTNDMIIKNYATLGDTEYLYCRNPEKSYTVDSYGPTVYISPSVIDDTNNAISLRINFNDKAGIKTLLIAKGKYNSTDSVWATSAAAGGAESLGVVGNFVNYTIKSNGIYTVYAADNNGNITTEHIAITNINPGQLIKPTVNIVKNNATKVKGTATAGLDINVEIGKKVYTGVVDSDGNYSVKIPVQNAKTKINVYVSDSLDRKSQVVTVAVKRVGPNCPTAKKITNKLSEISGNTQDGKNNIFVVIGSKVYVSDDGEYYDLCDEFNEDLKKEKTEITVKKSGKYTVKIPVLNYNKKVKIYCVDNLGRVSHVRSKTVKCVAPNKPILYDVLSNENYVYGFSKKGTGYKAVVKVDGETYSSKIKDSSGKFVVEVPNLFANTEIKVLIKGKVNGSTKKSVVKTVTVTDINSFITGFDGESLTMKSISDKTTKVKGKVSKAGYVSFVSSGKDYYSTSKSNGDYEVNFKNAFDLGDVVYMITRTKKGKVRGVAFKAVSLSAPQKPEIKTSVNKKTVVVTVYVTEMCLVTLTAGDRTYSTEECMFDDSEKAYGYKFTISNAKKLAGNKKLRLKATAKNEIGSTESDVLKVSIG